MAVFDELSVSPEQFQALGQEASQESTEVDADLSEDMSSELDSDIEVESDFWGDESEDSEGTQVEDSESEVEEGESDNGQFQTITYKANGKDVSIKLDAAGIEQLKKQLPLVDGARKAFSDKARIEQQFKQEQEARKELEPYKAGWDKLEAMKSDPRKLLALITGEDYDAFIEAEIAKRERYAGASEHERRIMDKEAEFERRDREYKAKEKAEADKAERVKEQTYELDKKDLSSRLEREHAKYDAPVTDDPVVANKIKKMLWTSAVADLKLYHQKYKTITPRMIEKAFGDNAAALQAAYNTTVDKRVQEASDKRKVEAKSKAQVAATRNYAPKTDKALEKLNPMDLFKKAFRK